MQKTQSYFSPATPQQLFMKELESRKNLGPPISSSIPGLIHPAIQQSHRGFRSLHLIPPTAYHMLGASACFLGLGSHFGPSLLLITIHYIHHLLMIISRGRRTCLPCIHILEQETTPTTGSHQFLPQVSEVHGPHRLNQLFSKANYTIIICLDSKLQTN